MAQVQETTEKERLSSSKNASKKDDASFSSVLLMLSILAVIICIPIIAIKFNILNAGEVLRPYISNSSKLQSILPTVEDPKNIETMNREQLLQLAKKNKIQIEEKEKKIIEMKKISETYTGDPNGLEIFMKAQQQLILDGEKLKDQELKYATEKNSFYEKIASQDLPQFKEYYEKLNPDAAKEIYTLAIEDEKAKESVKDFVAYYESMESSTATVILEKIAKTDIMLVTNIIKNMEKENGTKILSSMDPIIASRITSIMAGETEINN